MAGEINKSILNLEDKSRVETYHSFHKITLTQAAVILAKMTGRAEFTSSTAYQDAGRL